MVLSKENLAISNSIFEFEKKIDEMHLEVQRYCQSEVQKLPDWERLELDLVIFSRRKVIDLELSKQLDRVMYKFQNRKKIWLGWVEEFQQVKKEKPV